MTHVVKVLRWKAYKDKVIIWGTWNPELHNVNQRLILANASLTKMISSAWKRGDSIN